MLRERNVKTKLTVNKFEYISGMKKIGLLLLILVLQACADDKKKTEPRVEPSDEVSEDIQNLAKDEKMEEPISVRIPS